MKLHVETYKADLSRFHVYTVSRVSVIPVLDEKVRHARWQYRA